MALLPNQRRIYLNDFAEKDQELVNDLSIPINTNIEVLYQTLNKNVSLKDNVYGELKEFNISVDATGAPTENIRYQSTLSTSVLGMQVLKARHSSRTDVFVTSAPFISFTQSGKAVTINNITGLPANQSFILSVYVYGI